MDWKAMFAFKVNVRKQMWGYSAVNFVQVSKCQRNFQKNKCHVIWLKDLLCEARVILTSRKTNVTLLGGNIRQAKKDVIWSNEKIQLAKAVTDVDKRTNWNINAGKNPDTLPA